MTEAARTKQHASNWAVSFFTIWIGQALSLVGSGVAGFALVWWLARQTNSATVLATATLVSMLPGVFLGPFTGALVDRWNRRWVMIVADTIIAFFSAWLAFLFWIHALQIWHVYAIMFVRALGGAFHWPAMQASTSLMVPKEQLSRVAGMNQALHGILNIITPPLGAFLMEVMPLYAIMAIDVVTAVLAVGPLFFVHVPQPERRKVEKGGQPSLWNDVKEGFVYIWHWRGVFWVLVMATILNLLVNPGFSLMPILVRNHFHGEALQLGWMNSAWGLGVVLGGVTLSVWGGFRRKIYTSLLGLFGMGMGILVLGFAPTTAFWLGLVGMLLAGFMNPIVNGPFFAILQAVVAPEIQGRVFMVVGSMSAAASPLGMAIAGPVADWLGVQVWFVVGGITTFLMGIGMLFIPTVMHLEDHRASVQEAAVVVEGKVTSRPTGEASVSE